MMILLLVMFTIALAGLLMLLVIVKLGWLLTHGLGGMLLIGGALFGAVFVLRQERSAHRTVETTYQVAVTQPAAGRNREPIDQRLAVASPRIIVPPTSPAPTSPPVNIASTTDTDGPTKIIETLREFPGQMVRRKIDHIPRWVDAEDDVGPQGGTVHVLHSQRFATLGEARTQLEKDLQQQLLTQLRHEFPEMNDWPLPLSDMEAAGVILKECEVTWPLNVGEFKESVRQLHWQVLLSDITHQRLLAAGRPVLIRARLRQMAGIFVLAMLCFSAGALAFRRHSPVSSQHNA